MILSLLHNSFMDSVRLIGGFFLSASALGFIGIFIGIHMLTSDSKKHIKTIKDLLNSGQLANGKDLLDEQMKQEKALAEAIEFEQRNRKRKQMPNN